MKLSNFSFPYPIIASHQHRRDDYVKSSYHVDYEDYSDADNNQLKFEFNHKLSCEGIEQLIKTKCACYAINLNCKQTLVYKVFTSFDAKQNIQVPLDRLYGNFSLTPQIIVLKDIENFSPTDLNEEYGNASFQLKAGDVLAHGQQINRQCDFEKIARESLVKVKVTEELSPTEYSISVEDYKIIIYMGKTIHEVWNALASDPNHLGAHIYMSIYKDLNYCVLNEIVQDPENRETPWGKAWIRELGELGFEIRENADFNEINKLSQHLVAKEGVKKIHKNLFKRSDV